MQCLFRLLRVVHVGRAYPESCWAKGERIIVVFWHGRLLMMPFVYPGKPGALLISQHRDGEYFSRIAAILGFEAIRGSATRGGMRALRQMIRAIKGKLNLVITPDGPKGPRAKVKSGVIEIARLTGAPIVPVSFSASRRRFLKSWDAFLVPVPFSRAVYIWGEPIYVPSTAAKDEMAKHQEALEERLDLLTMKADDYFRTDP
ncbi:lysophospholipid acyltransferase family protein [Candidatus Methylomirabilis sp.]|uniref:Lysophospholipid acyltransferase family protein n=1 Tax=Candidatus Methylomirabilis tolerans TaxID=3123416 RepID=A0AAJ1AGW9_9BACT|nr:lysophospholipid acyltransferase family protein [Candidatus Methylomirabilis sp.]